MRTKAEIEEVMEDSISVAECFAGRIVSEEDDALMHTTHSKIKAILMETSSIAVGAKKLFDEVFEVDFTEYQWYCLVIILTLQFDLGKRVGVKKTMEFIEEMRV